MLSGVGEFLFMDGPLGSSLKQKILLQEFSQISCYVLHAVVLKKCKKAGTELCKLHLNSASYATFDRALLYMI